MAMKPLTRQAVERIASALIQKFGSTTTLEVKMQLRSAGFYAQQNQVSAHMKSIAPSKSWDCESAGRHLVYSLAMAPRGPIKPHVAGRSLTNGALSPEVPVIVLMTVNEHETDALLDSFLGVATVPPQTKRDGITYNILGQHDGHSIVHSTCEMGSGGIGAAQQRVRQAIDHWKPAAVIAVGIAFGLNKKKQRIGDVLISNQLQDYELARISKGGAVVPRGDKVGASDGLRNLLRQTDNREKRSASGWPRLRFGLILTGQKLLDNVDYRNSLKALHPEAIGGEMEGVGLYASAAVSKVDWIIIKGICDWGFDKNHAKKEAWQKLAARNAARVVRAALGGREASTNKTRTSPQRDDPTRADSSWRATFRQWLGNDFVIDGSLRGFFAGNYDPKHSQQWQTKGGERVDHPVVWKRPYYETFWGYRAALLIAPDLVKGWKLQTVDAIQHHFGQARWLEVVRDYAFSSGPLARAATGESVRHTVRAADILRMLEPTHDRISEIAWALINESDALQNADGGWKEFREARGASSLWASAYTYRFLASLLKSSTPTGLAEYQQLTTGIKPVVARTEQFLVDRWREEKWNFNPAMPWQEGCAALLPEVAEFFSDRRIVAQVAKELRSFVDPSGRLHHKSINTAKGARPEVIQALNIAFAVHSADRTLGTTDERCRRLRVWIAKNLDLGNMRTNEVAFATELFDLDASAFSTEGGPPHNGRVQSRPRKRGRGRTKRD